MKTIVALVDLSDLAFTVLKHAGKFATAFNGEVVILHMEAKEPVVVDMGLVSPVIMQEPSRESVQRHEAQLLEMRDSLIKSGVRASVQQLEGASVDAVLAETKKCHADLIILGSHHHSKIYDLLVGSVTNDVLKHAHCPVLVVPGDMDALEQK